MGSPAAAARSTMLTLAAAGGDVWIGGAAARPRRGGGCTSAGWTARVGDAASPARRPWRAVLRAAGLTPPPAQVRTSAPTSLARAARKPGSRTAPSMSAMAASASKPISSADLPLVPARRRATNGRIRSPPASQVLPVSTTEPASRSDVEQDRLPRQLRRGGSSPAPAVPAQHQRPHAPRRDAIAHGPAGRLAWTMIEAMAPAPTGGQCHPLPAVRPCAGRCRAARRASRVVEPAIQVPPDGVEDTAASMPRSLAAHGRPQRLPALPVPAHHVGSLRVRTVESVSDRPGRVLAAYRHVGEGRGLAAARGTRASFQAPGGSLPQGVGQQDRGPARVAHRPAALRGGRRRWRRGRHRSWESGSRPCASHLRRSERYERTSWPGDVRALPATRALDARS